MSAKWMVTCPNCSHEFTFSEISDPVSTDNRQFGVIPKPPGDKRKCPRCKTESHFETPQMFYRRELRALRKFSLRKLFGL